MLSIMEICPDTFLVTSTRLGDNLLGLADETVKKRKQIAYLIIIVRMPIYSLKMYVDNRAVGA